MWTSEMCSSAGRDVNSQKELIDRHRSVRFGKSSRKYMRREMDQEAMDDPHCCQLSETSDVQKR